MILLRLFGRVFLILALALLGLWITLWLSGQDFMKPGGQLWDEMHGASLHYIQQALEQYPGMATLWQDWLQNGLLQLPAWDGILRLFIWLMILAGIFLFLGRDRTRPRHSFRSKK